MVAGDHLSGKQFGEMTREEFESQPGTWFHSTSTGEIGHEGRFHVGTREAATEALAARINMGYVRPEHQQAVISRHPTARIFSGRIVGPMTNQPELSMKRGPGNQWNVKEGVPLGEMADWKRVDPHEAMSDVRANAIAPRLKNRGVYYVNASEDPGSISAALPKRSHFKTYEDYQREAGK